MAFEIGRFAELRPFLYHLTAAENLTHIRVNRSIAPAVDWMRRAKRMDLLRQRRKHHEVLQVNDLSIVLRDQRPLARGKIEFARGYTFEDLTESLNSRVFFWPGKADRPERTGREHFRHYERECPVIIRTEFQSLLAANQDVQVLFCKYNSGSPRIVNRKKSPRGPKTFARHAEFEGTVCDVVEVTFASEISLPDDAEFGLLPGGPWQRL